MHLEEAVKLTMFAAGLRSDDLALAVGADWVAEQVVAGRRELGFDAIQHAVNSRALRNGPARTIVSIATLTPDRLAPQAAYAIDWVDRFDGPGAYTKRRPRAPATWQQLQADIEDISARLGAASHVAITGSLRLAPAFTVGAALRMVTHTDIAVMQRGTPWPSDAPYSTPITPTSTEYDIGQGEDVAISIEVATTMTADVQAFLQDQHIPVGQLVVLGPPGGPRDNAVAGPEHACALAVGLRDAARRAAHGRPRLHLFLATPMGLALLLGHRWNRVAPTTVYEDLAAQGYEAAFTVSA
ncbi:MAG: SAVED domain-containing protein [Streptosporangiaceae bacterium]